MPAAFAARCEREQAAFLAAHPQVAGYGLRLLRVTGYLAVPLAAVFGLLAQAFIGGAGVDTPLFVVAGRQMFSGQWQSVFANPKLQVGPLFLTLSAVGSLVGEMTRLPPWVGFSVVTSATATTCGWLAMKSLHRALDCTRPWSRQWGGFAIVNGLVAVPLAAAYGHCDDLMVAYLLVVAFAAYRNDLAGRAGLILGLAVGVKLWAVLAVGFLAIGPWRRGLRACSVLGLVAATLFVPFVCSGLFGMFRLVWVVEDPAPLTFFMPNGANFTWALRILQALACLAVSVYSAQLTRRSPHAIWTIPVALVGCRMLLDPRWCPYYWAPLIGVLVAASWTVLTGSLLSVALLASAWLPFLFVTVYLFNEGVPERCVTVAVCAIAMATPLAVRRSVPDYSPVTEPLHPALLPVG